MTSSAATQVPSVVEAPTYLDTIKSRDNLVRNFPDLEPNLQTRNLGVSSGLTPSSCSRRSSAGIYSTVKRYTHEEDSGYLFAKANHSFSFG